MIEKINNQNRSLQSEQVEDIFEQTDLPKLDTNNVEKHISKVDNSQENQSFINSSAVKVRRKKSLIILLGVILVAILVGIALFFVYKNLVYNDIINQGSKKQTFIPNNIKKSNELGKPSSTETKISIEQSNKSNKDKNKKEIKVIKEQQKDNTLKDIIVKDSDQDGISDKEEKVYGTNPFSVDTDNDGLFDREEIFVYKTNPTLFDTDGDGFGDGTEVKNGYNPLGQGKLPKQIPSNK